MLRGGEKASPGQDGARGWIRDPEITEMYSRATGGENPVVAILGDPMYARRFKAAGWNVQPTILQEPSLAVRHWNELGIPTSKHAHALRADYFRDLQRRFKNERDSLIWWSEKAFGSHGPVISGGFHEHWPEAAKNWIRFLAHGQTTLADAVKLHEQLAKTRSHAFH